MALSGTARVYIVFWLILLCCVPARPETPAALPDAVEIDMILRQLADITGFRIYRRQPFQLVTRAQVNAYLKRQIQRTVKPSAIRAEEVTLKKFGFVPVDFDLRQTTIDLLTEQAAAYYDFRKKKLFISDWASRNMRQEALVHELAHALADQNFSIRRFLSSTEEDGEATVARESVVEGQATWLATEYAARLTGRTLADPDTARDLLRISLEAAEDAAYPVFSKAPLYIRITLMFPYQEGQKFQHAVFAREGRNAFATVFEKPPSATAQILHPERYLNRQVSKRLDLPRPLPRTSPLVTGELGELDHRILLRQYIDKETSEGLSPDLLGASFRIDDARHDHRLMLNYASEWGSEAAAQRFFAAYRQVLARKWKKLEVGSESLVAIRGKGDDGYFELKRTGSVVESREGFDRPFALN